MKQLAFCSLPGERTCLLLRLCLIFKGCVIKEKLIQLKVHCERLILLLKTLHLLPLAADCFLRPVGMRLANNSYEPPVTLAGCEGEIRSLRQL